MLMLPPEVRAAASLLMTWTRDEAVKMRAAQVQGPCVVLYELVESVCEFFLSWFKC
jgi:hypothetical protein